MHKYTNYCPMLCITYSTKTKNIKRIKYLQIVYFFFQNIIVSIVDLNSKAAEYSTVYDRSKVNNRTSLFRQLKSIKIT